MNLLDNLNNVMKPYITNTRNLTDNQLNSLSESIKDDDNPGSIIDNVEKSYIFVKKCLMTRNKGELFDNAKEFLTTNIANRFNHIAETFALGILLSNFGNLKRKVVSHFKELDFDFDNYWLLISLLHDYGMYIKEIDEFTIIDKIKEIGSHIHCYEYFKEKYHYTREIDKTYSIGEIIKYFDYRKNPQNELEPFDHGIIGGVTGYKYLLKSWSKTLEETNMDHKDFLEKGYKKQIVDSNGKVVNNLWYSKWDIIVYKQICYDIMQHNMWKPQDEIARNTYIKSNMLELSDKKIKGTENNPMYMLLSLVDTIEFIKRFCPIGENSKIRRMKHNPSSIANRISIDVTYDKIEIRYPDLYAFIKNDIEDKNHNEFTKWVESIENLPDWISVSTSKDINEEQITIYLAGDKILSKQTI